MSLKLPFSKINLSQSKKDVIACCLCLMMVILASQSHAFNIMMYSNVGRVFSIFFVLAIVYFNYILGFASIIFMGLVYAVHNCQREGLEGNEASSCKSYLLECEDCKKMGNGSFCELHATLCDSSSSSSDVMDIDGKESMCPMKRKKKTKEGMVNLIDKERKMQLGTSSTTSSSLLPNYRESFFSENVIAYDGSKEISNSFP
jgi:hypothetical protein